MSIKETYKAFQAVTNINTLIDSIDNNTFHSLPVAVQTKLQGIAHSTEKAIDSLETVATCLRDDFRDIVRVTHKDNLQAIEDYIECTEDQCGVEAWLEFSTLQDICTDFYLYLIVEGE